MKLNLKTSKFRYEKELVNFFIKALPNIIPSKGGNHFSFAREVVTGKKIADIVILLSRKNSHTIPIKPFTTLESVLIATLRRQGTLTINELEAKCGLPYGHLKNGILENLKKSGLIGIKNNRSVILKNFWKEDHKIIAIEAKLTRWQEALKQAVKYQDYADESYVLMPNSLGLKTSQFKKFKQMGVGLFFIHENSINKILSAKKSTDHNWRREHVKSRLMGRSEFAGMA